MTDAEIMQGYEEMTEMPVDRKFFAKGLSIIEGMIQNYSDRVAAGGDLSSCECLNVLNLYDEKKCWTVWRDRA